MLSNGPDPYDFQCPPKPPCPPGPHPPVPPGPFPPPPPPPSPGTDLPIYPTYYTEVINGRKYKIYPETSWTQVITEDGVSLKDLLESLPIYDESKFYHYKGILYNLPEVKAIDRLHNLHSPTIGDVWLVETTYLSEGKFVFEVYVYLGDDGGWVCHGSTNIDATVNNALSNTLRLIPSEIGDADEIMIVSPDGKSIIWSNPIRTHNADPEAHPDIRKSISDIIPDAAEKATAAVLQILSESTLILDGGGQPFEPEPEPEPDPEPDPDVDPDSPTEEP